MGRVTGSEIAAEAAQTVCSGEFNVLFCMTQVHQRVKLADRTKTPSTWDGDANAAQGAAAVRFCDG
jgi:hypothetical protein